MAMSNAERQRRWLEKNRALHNFRRRKKKLSGAKEPVPKLVRERVGSISEPTQPSTVEELKELVKETRIPEERSTMPVVKPLVFRNDHGAVISEKVWNELQEKKRIANERGYEFDPQ